MNNIISGKKTHNTKEVNLLKNDRFERYAFPFFVALLLLAAYKAIDNASSIYRALLHVLSVFSPIFIAIAIALIMYPVCKRAEDAFASAKIHFVSSHARMLSVIMVYAALAALLASIFCIIVPLLSKSITSFVKAAPSMIDAIVQKINRTPFFNIEAKGVFASIERFIAASPLARPEVYTSTVIGVSRWLANTVLSFIMSVYILVDRESLIRWAKFALGLFVTPAKQAWLKKYALKALFFIGRYFYCSVIDAIIIFGLSLLILLVLRVKHAPALSLVLGIFNLVPYFGSVCATAIAVIVTLITTGLPKAITVGVCLLVLGQLDGNVIAPHIVKVTLSLKPFWVLAGVFVGGGFFGIWGIVLSVPIVAFGKYILCDIIKTSHLQKR